MNGSRWHDKHTICSIEDGIRPGLVIWEHGMLTHWSGDIMVTNVQTALQIHFLEWTRRILIQMSLKFVPESPVKNHPALVQLLAGRFFDEPLYESIMAIILTQLCIIQSQWHKRSSEEFWCYCLVYHIECSSLLFASIQPYFLHADIMIWKHFPHYGTCVTESAGY